MSTHYGNYTIVEIVNVLQTQKIGAYSTASVAAYILYECTCELEDALKLFWRARTSIVTILFAVNWCAMLLWVAVNLPITVMPVHSHSRCEISNLLGPALDVLLLSVWTMFMTIRTYAISGYNWWTTTSVFVLCAMPVGMSAYGYFAHRHFELVKLPIIGDTCLDTSDISAGFMLTLEIITRISFLLPDIVVLLLTVVKTHAARRESKHHSMIAPFSALLLHNGNIHVLWMMKLHIANAVAFAFSRRWASTFFIASTFLNPGMAIAISRFHLTLRRMAYELDDTGDPRLLSFSRIRDPEDAASHLSGPIFYDPGMAEEWSDTESDNVQLDNVPLNPEERGKLYIDADDGGRDLKRTRHEDEPVI